MMLRMVAGEAGRLSARATVSDPTGSAVAIYNPISDLRTSLLRSSKGCAVTVLLIICRPSPADFAADELAQVRDRQALRLSHGRAGGRPRAPSPRRGRGRPDTRCL